MPIWRLAFSRHSQLWPTYINACKRSRCAIAAEPVQTEVVVSFEAFLDDRARLEEGFVCSLPAEVVFVVNRTTETSRSLVVVTTAEVKSICSATASKDARISIAVSLAEDARPGATVALEEEKATARIREVKRRTPSSSCPKSANEPTQNLQMPNVTSGVSTIRRCSEPLEPVPRSTAVL